MVDYVSIDVLLGASIIDRCIRRNFPTEHETIPWNLKPMAIVLTRTATTPMNALDAVLNVNANLHDDASRDKCNLCRNELEISILTYMQAAVFVSYQGARRLTIETCGRIVECG